MYYKKLQTDKPNDTYFVSFSNETWNTAFEKTKGTVEISRVTVDMVQRYLIREAYIIFVT